MTPGRLQRFGVLTRLPEGYRLVMRLTLESTSTVLMLNFWGIILLGIGGLFYSALYSGLNSAGIGSVNFLSGATDLGMLIAAIVAFLMMLTVHELLHGLGFQFFGARPRYGVKWSMGVAYASAEAYYVPRKAYYVIGLLPLIAITVMSILLMLVCSGETCALVGLIGAGNIGGSVGDIWFVLTCRRYSDKLLVRDYGEGAELYAPINGS